MVGVMDEAREENLTICEGRDEVGNYPTEETWKPIKRNRPYLARDGKRTTLLVIKASREYFCVLKCKRDSKSSSRSFQRVSMTSFIGLCGEMWKFSVVLLWMEMYCWRL